MIVNIFNKTKENLLECIWENQELVHDIINNDDIQNDDYNHLIIAIDFDIALKIKTDDYSYLHEQIIEILNEI